jgi:hypothetical protein
MCQLLDDYDADKQIGVPQMISSRRWSCFLRRLAVCVDQKCRIFEEGTAALLSDKGLGNLAGGNPGISDSGPICSVKPVEPILRACHSSKRLSIGQEEKRKKQNAGCKISRKAGCLSGSSNRSATNLSGSSNRSATTRLPPTSADATENLTLNVGYLQALVGGLPTQTQADEPAS